MAGEVELPVRILFLKCTASVAKLTACPCESSKKPSLLQRRLLLCDQAMTVLMSGCQWSLWKGDAVLFSDCNYFVFLAISYDVWTGPEDFQTSTRSKHI